MDHIDLLVAAFRRQMSRDYDAFDYLKAGEPFGPDRGALWLAFQEGTTVN